jgi:hypothetical protein
MAGYAVVESGNYDLEIDTGYLWDGFTLDDVTKGKIGSTDYVLDGTTQYASVMNGTMSLNAKRGRRDIGDQFTFGTMNFVLNDTLAGGVFNPFDTNSPYYNPANNQPGLAPLRKVRFSRYNDAGVKKYLWVGYIVNYDYTYNLGGVDTIAVNCADAFYLLAQTYLAAWNVSSELSGTRIANLLALPEVGYTGTTSLASGTATLGGSAAYGVSVGTSAATYANQINAAEQGRVFINRDGTFVFQNRIGNTLSTSSADFHDDGTQIPYQGVDISFQADQVKNRASVVHAGSSTAQVAEDLASQAKYLIQTISITSSLISDDAGALALAQYLIVGKPAARFNYLDTKFASMTSAQKDSVALVDVGDTITIQKQVKTGSTTSTQLAQQLSVEGLEHRLTLSGGHEVSYYTAPTTIVYQLVLNDVVYGVTDSTNVLG